MCVAQKQSIAQNNGEKNTFFFNNTTHFLIDLGYVRDNDYFIKVSLPDGVPSFLNLFCGQSQTQPQTHLPFLIIKCVH